MLFSTNTHENKASIPNTTLYQSDMIALNACYIYTEQMKYYYLTIDDVSTKNTPKIIDFLNSKKITPIMFCWGKQLEKYPDEAIYALKHGAILQNHTYSHHFSSKISFKEFVEDVEKNEKILSDIYKKAGVNRPFKLFRFPYGDIGGENRAKIQQYLKEQGFSHIDDSAFPEGAYGDIGYQGQKECLDVLWTFDFAEYNMRPNKNFTFEDVVKRVDAAFPKSAQNTPASSTQASGIVIIHDHEESEDIHPSYFSELINMLLDRGVRFVEPAIR